MRTLFSNPDERDGAAPESLLATDAAPEYLAEAWRSARAEQARVGKPVSPSAVLRVIRGICFLIAAITVASLVKSEVSLATAYGNAPAIFWVGGIALAVALAILLIQELLKRRNSGKPDAKEAALRLGQTAAQIRSCLNVPQYAAPAEVLSFPSPGNPQLAALRQVHLFRRGNDLCLFDGLQIYALPLAGAALRLEESALSLERSSWTKPLPPSHRQFRPYGVTARKKGPIGLRFCCALELWKDGEQLRLLFPAYELSQVQYLTGLEAPPLP